MSDDINKKHIEKQMSLLEKIYFDDSDKYTNKERAEAAQKHQWVSPVLEGLKNEEHLKWVDY